MNLIDTLKSRPLILIIIVIFLATLVITAIIELRKPSSTPPLADVEIIEVFESNLNSIAISPGTINITTTFNNIENFQEEVEILNYTPDAITSEEVSTTIQQLGITETKRESVAGVGEIIDAEAWPKNLTVYKEFGTIIYTEQIQIAENTNYTFDANSNVEEYTTKSNEFIRSMGININKYELTKTNYLVYPSAEPIITNNLSTAGLIELIYTAKTEDISIINSPDNLSPSEITVWIDKNFVIRKAYISTVGAPSGATARLKAKTIEEIRRDIQNGEATLINSSFGPHTKILYTAVESAELMYYASGDRLIPVYVINARLTSENGEEGTGKLILKAF